MDIYRELGDRLKGMHQAKTALYQGLVKSVEGKSCTITIDGLDIPDVRLRASMTESEEEILLTPKVGSTVIVGSLTGDYNHLVVLTMDKVDTIALHGGKQGGLVLIEPLTDRLNKIEQDLNNLKQAITSAPIVPSDGGASLKAGLASWAGQQIIQTKVADLENPKIKQ